MSRASVNAAVGMSGIFELSDTVNSCLASEVFTLVEYVRLQCLAVLVVVLCFFSTFGEVSVTNILFC